MSDKMREEFEVFAVNHAHSLNYSFPEDAVQLNGLGDYAIVWVQGAWLGWQASRAALVVELPADCKLSRDGLDECHPAGQLRDDIIEAIHAAGVKTK